MLTAAGKRKAPADAVAARHQCCLSGWRRGRRRSKLEIGIHAPPDLVVQEGGDVTAVTVDHGAPTNRAVRHRQCLEYAELGKRIEFRATPRAWHGHAEHAGSLQPFDN